MAGLDARYPALEPSVIKVKSPKPIVPPKPSHLQSVPVLTASPSGHIETGAYFDDWTAEPEEREAYSQPRTQSIQLASSAGADNKWARSAEWFGQRANTWTDRAATYLDQRSATYTASRAATDSPVRISETHRGRIEGFSKATVRVADATKKGLDFAGRHAERAAGVAVQRVSERIPDKAKGSEESRQKAAKRFGDATDAFQTIWQSLETNGDKLFNSANRSFDTVVTHRYGSEAAATSGQVLKAGHSVFKVVKSTRGVPVMLVKSAGKGAIKVKMRDGKEQILPANQAANGSVERTGDGDLILLNDDIVEVSKA